MNNTTELKKSNMLKMVSAIQKNKTLAKPEIARIVKVTQVTAHNFINDLVLRGFLLENGSAKSIGGRKATLYKINPSFCCMISLNITVNGLTTTLYNLEMDVIYSHILDVFTGFSEKTIDILLEEIHKALCHAADMGINCFGVGITVPGRVDPETGVVKNFINIPDWHSVPLQAYLEQRLSIPVTIGNDNAACALAMKYLGLVDDRASAVFVSVTSGVGMGVLNEGALLKGAHGSAGEIGHTTVFYNGTTCNCGNKGCIEALTSYPYLIDQANGKNSELTIENIHQLISCAKAGDKDVLEVLDQAAQFIRIMLDHIAKSFDPELIVIDNAWLLALNSQFHHLVDTLFEKNRFLRHTQLRILLNTEPEILRIAGATLVLDNLLTSLTGNPLLDALV